MTRVSRSFTAMRWQGGRANPTSLDRLIRRREAGEFDLIAVGRALITDANWVAKVHAGDDAGLTPFRHEDLASFV
jgi:2,4-dienoyl-CoA reductase-like NADH-dependent reductase (Old Yellow Enzyme family)